MASHGETSKDEVITKPLTAFFTATNVHNVNRFTHHF